MATMSSRNDEVPIQQRSGGKAGRAGAHRCKGPEQLLRDKSAGKALKALASMAVRPGTFSGAEWQGLRNCRI